MSDDEKITDAGPENKTQFFLKHVHYRRRIMQLPDPGRFLPEALRIGEEYEFATFLIGARLKSDLSHSERSVLTMPLKRALGIMLETRYWPDRSVDFKTPDIQLLLNLEDFTIDVMVKPIHIAGRYKKYSRDISSSHWRHMKCHGMGCSICNFKGFFAEGSVGEIIGNPILADSKGEKYYFHGMGREDIDARMLGNGRPFVVEIAGPHLRNLDLERLKDEININGSGRAEIYGPLAKVSPETKGIIKGTPVAKTYNAFVVTGTDLPPDAAERIASLSGSVLKQWTPTRVRHRRGDMERIRKVFLSFATILDSRSFIWQVKTESGTYVKELASSDGDRTKPSLSGLLCVPAIVVELDVAEIHYSVPWQL